MLLEIRRPALPQAVQLRHMNAPSLPRSSGPRVSLAAVLLLLPAAGCILLSSNDADVQCSSDADCSDLGAVCDVDNNVCVSRAGGVGGGSTASASSGDVSASTGAGGGGGQDAECTTNDECIDASGQQPYICRNSTCISLITENCVEFIGDVEQLKGNDPLIFGLVSPYVEEIEASDGILTRSAVRLAVEEIESATEGLPIGEAGARRQVVFLSCDELTDYIEGVRFLVEDVGVPAILGPNDPSKALEVSSEVTVDSGTMLVTPTGSSSLAKIEDSGLVWLTRYEGRGAGEAQAALLEAAETDLRTFFELAEEDPVRIAVLQRADATGAEMFAGFQEKGTVNGLDIIENIDAGYLLPVAIPLDGTDFSGEIVSVIEHQPHLIMAFMQVTGGAAMIAAITQVETSWPQDGTAFPLWSLDGAQKSALVYRGVGELTATVEGETRPIYVTVAFVPKAGTEARDNFNSFSVRFRARFVAENGLTAGTGEGPQAYDAAYLLSYAAIGAGSVAVLDGRAIAGGMRKLGGPGARIDIGPEYVQQAISSLKAGTSIQLVGTLRDYTFSDQGNIEAIYASGCWDGVANSYVPSFTGFTYDPLVGAPEGAFGCPLGE